MLLHNDKKSIFIHNPKCGGTYIKKILLKNYNFTNICSIEKHNEFNKFIRFDEKLFRPNEPVINITKLGLFRYYSSHQNNYKELLDNYFTFSFVRNPYEKFVSAYLFLKDNVDVHYESYNYYIDLHTFIEKYKDICCGFAYYHAFITQTDILLNYDNKINISYIGRQESLDIELFEIIKILNFV